MIIPDCSVVHFVQLVDMHIRYTSMSVISQYSMLRHIHSEIYKSSQLSHAVTRQPEQDKSIPYPAMLLTNTQHQIPKMCPYIPSHFF